jgi:hypothetical protein
MLSEKEFIETCKRLIEQKFSLPQSDVWKQRDFDYLSDLIFEKTETRISISTLKRIWKNDDNRLPQLYTLNTLARFAGFESWSDFKQQHNYQPNANQAKPIEPKAGIKRWKILLVSVPVVLITLALLVYFKQSTTSYKQTDILFKSRKNVSTGVPNTVVFEYDLSKVNFDSAFIQHSWDKRLRARVTKDNHFQTFIYYYPGFHTARLIVDNKDVKKEFINITTPGWQALVDGTSPDGLPQYISNPDIFSNGQLYVSKETLNKNRIAVEDKTFWISYFNVREFKQVNASDFTLETRIKNNLDEGALTCQYSQVTIICEKGMISVPFSNPGCIANIHLHIGEVLKNGSKNDLSYFGVDLSNWRNIKIQTIRKQVEVYVDDKKIFHLPYKQDLGHVTGFHYKFYGCGAIDMVMLYNAKNELRFGDELEVKP